jgi:hypothetical protein
VSTSQGKGSKIRVVSGRDFGFSGAFWGSEGQRAPRGKPRGRGLPGGWGKAANRMGTYADVERTQESGGLLHASCPSAQAVWMLPEPAQSL